VNVVCFDGRNVTFDYQELDELILACACTIHKSQGSEYPAAIVPMHTQAYMLLQRNPLYTALTRRRKLVVIVGSKKAVAMAVKRVDSRQRVTTLSERRQHNACFRRHRPMVMARVPSSDKTMRVEGSGALLTVRLSISNTA
jgi:ATP-dependent exoDNAse (exonuclease V) alpha subunit